MARAKVPCHVLGPLSPRLAAGQMAQVRSLNIADKVKPYTGRCKSLPPSLPLHCDSMFAIADKFLQAVASTKN